MSSLLFPLTFDPRKKRRRKKRNYNRKNPFYGKWYNRSNYRNYARNGQQSEYNEMMANMAAHDVATNIANRNYERKLEFEKQRQENKYYANMGKNQKLRRMTDKNAVDNVYHDEIYSPATIDKPYLSSSEVHQIASAHTAGQDWFASNYNKPSEVVVFPSDLGAAARQGYRVWRGIGAGLALTKDLQKTRRLWNNVNDIYGWNDFGNAALEHVGTMTGQSAIPDRSDVQTQLDVHSLRDHINSYANSGRMHHNVEAAENAVVNREMKQIDQSPLNPIPDYVDENEPISEEQFTSELTNGETTDISRRYKEFISDPYNHHEDFWNIVRESNQNINNWIDIMRAANDFKENKFEERVEDLLAFYTGNEEGYIEDLDGSLKFFLDSLKPDKQEWILDIIDGVGKEYQDRENNEHQYDIEPTPTPLPTAMPEPRQDHIPIPEFQRTNRIIHSGSSYRHPLTQWKRSARYYNSVQDPGPLIEHLRDRDDDTLANLIAAKSFVNKDWQNIFLDVIESHPMLQRNEITGDFLKHDDPKHGYMHDTYMNQVKKYIPYEKSEAYHRFEKAYIDWAKAHDDLKMSKYKFPETYFGEDIAATEAWRKKIAAQQEIYNRGGNYFYKSRLLPSGTYNIKYNDVNTGEPVSRNAYVVRQQIPEFKRLHQNKIIEYASNPENLAKLNYYSNQLRNIKLQDRITKDKRDEAIVDAVVSSYNTINHLITGINDVKNGFNEPNWLAKWFDEEGSMPVNLHVNDYIPAFLLYHTMLHQMEDTNIKLKSYGMNVSPNIDDITKWIETYMSYMPEQWQNVWQQKEWTDPRKVWDRVSGNRWKIGSYKDEPLKTTNITARDEARMKDYNWQTKYNFTDPKTGFNYRTNRNISKLGLSFYAPNKFNKFRNGRWQLYQHWPTNKLFLRRPIDDEAYDMPLIEFDTMNPFKEDITYGKKLHKKLNDTRFGYPSKNETLMKRYAIRNKRQPWNEVKKWFKRKGEAAALLWERLLN